MTKHLSLSDFKGSNIEKAYAANDEFNSQFKGNVIEKGGAHKAHKYLRKEGNRYVYEGFEKLSPADHYTHAYQLNEKGKESRQKHLDAKFKGLKDEASFHKKQADEYFAQAEAHTISAQSKSGDPEFQTKPKHKAYSGAKFYSPFNKDYPAEITHVRTGQDGYDHAYKLKLKDQQGNTYSSHWVNEKSLSESPISNEPDVIEKGGAHKSHKYLRIENGKYIYDHSKMTSQDHRDEQQFHIERAKHHLDNWERSKQTKKDEHELVKHGKHVDMANEHQKLANEKESSEYRIREKGERLKSHLSMIDNNIDLKDVTVEATPKGNWQVYHKGKALSILNGKELDDETIRHFGLEHHSDEGVEIKKSELFDILGVESNSSVIEKSDNPADASGDSYSKQDHEHADKIVNHLRKQYSDEDLGEADHQALQRVVSEHHPNDSTEDMNRKARLVRQKLNDARAQKKSDNISKAFDLLGFSEDGSDLLEKGAHANHKYLRIENGKYIYDNAKMSAKDHDVEANRHRMIANDKSHAKTKEQREYHSKLADEHETLSKDKSKKGQKKDVEKDKSEDHYLDVHQQWIDDYGLSASEIWMDEKTKAELGKIIDEKKHKIKVFSFDVEDEDDQDRFDKKYQKFLDQGWEEFASEDNMGQNEVIFIKKK